MSGLANAISKLRALSAVGLHAIQSSRLELIQDFGSNPGNLRAKAFIPTGLSPKSPLVVVLHGCTQTPEGYDIGSGWSDLAEAQRFVVLYPEQHRSNNPTLCFNWFEPNDTKRGTGEAASIRHMIDAMIETYDLDPDRIFITGLSAGGAMTSAMLAAYPDLFAGGAIIGGLPAGSAHGVSEALQQMRSPRKSHFARIGRRLAQQRALPIVSVWHGGADHTVNSANADAIVEQWLVAHEASSVPELSVGHGYQRQSWRDASGREVIEQFTIEGMGHGVPLATDGPDALGSSGAYMLDVGLSSSHHIARFWGLEEKSAGLAQPIRPRATKAATSGISQPTEAGLSGPKAVIENALRAAGLMG